MNLTVRPVTVRAGHGPRQIAPQVMHTLGVKRKLITMMPILLALLVAASAVTSNETIEIRSKAVLRVLNVVQCENPEFVLDTIRPGLEMDIEQLYRDTGALPFTFDKVRIGPGQYGYRAVDDPRAAHQTWFHTWLFELREKHLVLVYEAPGPGLSIDESVVVNGRYRFIEYRQQEIRHIEWDGVKYAPNPYKASPRQEQK